MIHEFINKVNLITAHRMWNPLCIWPLWRVLDPREVTRREVSVYQSGQTETLRPVNSRVVSSVSWTLNWPRTQKRSLLSRIRSLLPPSSLSVLTNPHVGILSTKQGVRVFLSGRERGGYRGREQTGVMDPRQDLLWIFTEFGVGLGPWHRTWTLHKSTQRKFSMNGPKP